MQIREGAYYRTRGSDVFGPMARTSLKDTKYVWRIGGDTSPYSWTEEGYWRPGYSDQFDLISEVYVSDTPSPKVETLRDRFAGLSLEIAYEEIKAHTRIGITPKAVAETAYAFANAMMEARKK
jgi:hypothetical protein